MRGAIVRMIRANDDLGDIINCELDAVEASHDVRVLYACESGSRAWGFASPDSDYDVRFVYVHDPAWYLRLEDRRDVIEWKLDDVLDINGWDLAKLLRLMRNSNPTVFEWLASPIVYRELPQMEPVRLLAPRAFQLKPDVYHYLHMARGNYGEFLQGEQVRVKKYLYVVRPLLAARWVIDERTAPPMPFADLADSKLDPSVRPVIEQLLAEKAHTSELGSRPRIDSLNAWIERQISELDGTARTLPRQEKLPWEEFDEAFCAALAIFHAT